MTTILQTEEWWLFADQMGNVQSEAFSDELARLILHVGDCTNKDVQGSDTDELVRQQLYSVYYGTECGKYYVGCSTIGGTTAISPGQGGPAGDHQCMVAAGIFQEEKWRVPSGPRLQMLYDAGVPAKTKTLATSVNCDLVTSGISRKSAKNTLSSVQRMRISV